MSLSAYSVPEHYTHDDILQDFCYTFNLLISRFDNLDFSHISAETFDYNTAADALLVIGPFIIVPDDYTVMNDNLGFFGTTYTYHLYTRACALLNNL